MLFAEYFKNRLKNPPRSSRPQARVKNVKCLHNYVNPQNQLLICHCRE